MTGQGWVFLLLAAGGGQDERPDTVHHFTVFEENDFFGHVSKSDKHYTQGIRLDYQFRQPIGPDGTGEPLFTLRRLYAREGRGLYFTNGLAIGHEMYTPEVITDPLPNPTDRPYVAWLYLGFLTTVSDVGNRWQDTWEIDLGTVGPRALGDEVQSGWHELIGQDNPTWAGQLPNEPGLVASWKRQWVHDASGEPGSDWSLLTVTGVGASVGTVVTELSLETKFLFGYRTPPDFEAGRGLRALEDPDRLRVYGFLGIEGRFVPWNLFLDGTVFRESADISRKYLVADFSGGLVVRLWEVLGLSYAQVFRSGEIDTDPRFHNFGSIAISCTFGF